jgi:lipopolysaccharide transport system ATP-binding protein
VDEALSVGDVFFVQKCMRFINKFKESNTLILVTHDTQSVLSVCTHGLVLSEGIMIAGKTTSKQAIDAYTNDYYGGRIGASGNISTNRTATGRVNEVQDRQKSSRQPSVIHGATESDGSVYATALERVLNQMILTGHSIHTNITASQDTGEFGNNECRIIRISVCNLDANKSALIAEGERIVIEITIECLEDVSFPIVGFAIRNNNGLAVIGENTFQTGYGERSNYEKGEFIRARFTFTLPRLAPGKYSVHAAVARGTQQDHVQMHYFHDVCAFEVVSLKASSALICPSDMNSEILVTSDGPS